MQGPEGFAFDPTGQIFAIGGTDNTVNLLDVASGNLLHTLNGHFDRITNIEFDPTGQILASGSYDGTVNLWNMASWELLHTLKGHFGRVSSIKFDPTGQILASGGADSIVNLWNTLSGEMLHTLEGKHDRISNIEFDPTGHILASGSSGKTVTLWDVTSGELLYTLEGNNMCSANIAFYPRGCILALGGGHKEIQLWDAGTGKLSRTLEGHMGSINCVVFAPNIPLFASRGVHHREIRLWRIDTFHCVANINFGESDNDWLDPNIVFHPHLPYLAGVIWDTSKQDGMPSVIHIYELDLSVLLSNAIIPMVTYTSAKVVLVGDSGVGKTGLGWTLAHGEFKEHSSTHGQQFWLLNQLCKQRDDGAQCEAVLWDLAGQPDYRLIHALFLDDADLALVLFDPTHNDDPLSGVEFWLKQLKVGTHPLSGTPTVLIAARSDRGTPRLTKEELNAFCKQRGIKAYLLTSAKSGEGIDELVQEMQNLIPWDAKPATVTTETFKRIKDFILDMKENNHRRKMILTPKELRQRLVRKNRKWKFSDAEMITAVGHLENHGYVKRLKTSKGEPRILLAPELLNNLAASFVLEARRNQEGLGSLEEKRLLSGEYKFPELEKLTEAEKDVLLDSGTVLFLEHNVCFRETNPLNNRAYLVFPELINMKKPLIGDDALLEDGVAYTVSGAVENVYASLVVLMGYTQTFTRTNHWQNHARYEVGKGLVCGFRLEEERAGELDFVLYFGTNTPAPVRTLFQSLFENFLARRNLTVRRYEPVVCSKGHTLNRAVVRQKMASGAEFTFCNDCGEKIVLPKADQPIQLTKRQAEEVEANRRIADQRSRFEQVLFRLKSYVTDQEIISPECFISYAWGNPDQELWVERSLAKDLQKAGIKVVLDQWENARIGASVPRFVERVGKTDRVLVVGTPLYRKKYDNNEPIGGFVVAAEGDLIGKRMIGTEADKESVLPVLLDGSDKSAFPIILQGRVYADFRKSEAYFDEVFKLLLSLYHIEFNDPVATELRESLAGQREYKIP
ncbi:MAG: hypothetical protein QG591_963 [Planctomycetota bacterium]|nr:hypothetical protein [Planctomycetota bacterium]